MQEESSSYREQVEAQKEELLTFLAQIGVARDWSTAIPDPDPESPLMEIVYALKLLSENLDSISREREWAIQQAQEKAEIIRRQSQAILELSTPVIEIWDEILICPLIGAIDTIRAHQILENLLEAVAAKQCQVVIIDITGVSVVDTSVANHLIVTINALSTLGVYPILTGVSTHNAQMLARLGVDMSGIKTLSSLQRGLHDALEFVGLEVRREDAELNGVDDSNRKDVVR